MQKTNVSLALRLMCFFFFNSKIKLLFFKNKIKKKTKTLFTFSVDKPKKTTWIFINFALFHRLSHFSYNSSVYKKPGFISGGQSIKFTRDWGLWAPRLWCSSVLTSSALQQRSSTRGNGGTLCSLLQLQPSHQYNLY